jgi:hypothetical protein
VDGEQSLSTTDDGFTIYDTDALFSTVIAAAKFASLSGLSASNSTSSTSMSTTTTAA